MTGTNRIMIYGPKEDGTYVIEFRTADGDVLWISRSLDFQERMPHGLSVPDEAISALPWPFRRAGGRE